MDTCGVVLLERPHGALHQCNLNRPTSPPANDVEFLDFASTAGHNRVARQRTGQIPNHRPRIHCSKTIGIRLCSVAIHIGADLLYRAVRTWRAEIGAVALPEGDERLDLGRFERLEDTPIKNFLNVMLTYKE